MINVFSEIYKEIKKEITAYQKTVDGKNLLSNRKVIVLNAYTQSSAKFPVITIEEKNNTFYSTELNAVETHSKLMYDINIYDNSTDNKVQTVYKLAEIIDKVMSAKFNFKRIKNEPIQNVNDQTIFRMVQRYECVINTETYRVSKI